MATKPGVESGIPDPKELAAIKSSVQGKENAPSQQLQAGAYGNWKTLATSLAQPFDVERIPVTKLRQMRRDPMLAFGLYFVKSSLVKAIWNIDAKDKSGPNAQIAGFIDEALREIYPRLIFQYALSLDFGFSAMVKRFKQDVPAGQFMDENGNFQPIWTESTPAIMWKTFVALPPEFSEPIWTPQGDFGGILYTIPPDAAAAAKGKSEIKYDIYHSLWATNEKDSVFGNIFGYPRLGYAYRYWYSYWLWWAMHDRHFEKDADPAAVVRYPPGKHITADGSALDNSEIALEIGEQARSGSTIALPSDVQIDATGARTNLYDWDIDFLKGGENFEAFLSAFEYVDVLKLRSIWAPEQALIEGGGGTSSRNVATQMGDLFQESQAVLMMEIDETINKFVIPQLLAENFPEFINNGGTARKVTKGFATEDIDFVKQLIQLVGNQDPMALGVDYRQVIEDLGIPVLKGTAGENAQQRLQSLNTQPALQPGTPSQVGVSPARALPGGTNVSQRTGVNQPTTTGFQDVIYVQPNPFLGEFSDSTKFVSSLPRSKHYEDSAIKAMAVQMYNLWHKELSAQYDDFANWFAKQNSLELADSSIEKKVRSLVRRWQGDRELLKGAMNKTLGLAKRMVGRAASIELKRANLSSDEFNMEGDPVAGWVEANVTNMADSIDNTVREELTRFLTNEFESGRSQQEISARLREHFNDFPAWKAARIARTATRDVYNAATLFAADAAGIEHVQAIDAQYGPTDQFCEDRDGEIFTINEALKQDEHPNGTLAWRVLKASDLKVISDFSVNGASAKFDPETSTVYLSNTLSKKERKEFLMALGDALCR